MDRKQAVLTVCLSSGLTGLSCSKKQLGKCLGEKKKNWLKRALYGMLALHFLFVFCAIDLFHTDTCPIQSKDPKIPFQPQADDGCPACNFKVGANAEQPQIVNMHNLVQPVFGRLYIPIETMQGNEPACCLYLRAPPFA